MNGEEIVKKLSVATIVFVLIISVAAAAIADVQGNLVGKAVEGLFPVVLNGSTLDKQAIVIDGTSYLPVRTVAEALNMNVSFENNTVILEKTNSSVANQGDGQRFGPLTGIDQILGMTTEELQTELISGTTLEQIAGDKGMTLEQLKEKWLVYLKTELDSQVSQGKLTAEQAQNMMTKLQDTDLSKLGAGPEMGGDGPFEGPQQTPPANTDQQN